MESSDYWENTPGHTAEGQCWLGALSAFSPSGLALAEFGGVGPVWVLVGSTDKFNFVRTEQGCQISHKSQDTYPCVFSHTQCLPIGTCAECQVFRYLHGFC